MAKLHFTLHINPRELHCCSFAFLVMAIKSKEFAKSHYFLHINIAYTKTKGGGRFCKGHWFSMHSAKGEGKVGQMRAWGQGGHRFVCAPNIAPKKPWKGKRKWTITICFWCNSFERLYKASKIRASFLPFLISRKVESYTKGNCNQSHPFARVFMVVVGGRENACRGRCKKAHKKLCAY